MTDENFVLLCGFHALRISVFIWSSFCVAQPAEELFAYWQRLLFETCEAVDIVIGEYACPFNQHYWRILISLGDDVMQMREIFTSKFTYRYSERFEQAEEKLERLTETIFLLDLQVFLHCHVRLSDFAVAV